MTNTSIYQDIKARTDGDIYVGVVGPVRTGKSTFIKRFMETLVIPNIENVYVKERARDELPQSGSGRTIMTSEPKFVPEDAVSINLDGGVDLSVRLIDCVGYMVPGAAGQFEDGIERMVTTPWFEHEVSLTEAAEEGTRKVINEHSTIGLVITTDGSICDIPRENYCEAEERVISELKAIRKPFVILLNSTNPEGEEAKALCDELREQYGVTTLAVNCQTLEAAGIETVLNAVLGEFPLVELGFFLPSWLDALPMDIPLKSELFGAIAEEVQGMKRMCDVFGVLDALGEMENIHSATPSTLKMGTGAAYANVDLPRELYYRTMSEQSGFTIESDGDLMALLTDMRDIKEDYDRISGALRDVREKGYGIVMPAAEELQLEEPKIVRHGGRYGVKLKASAPSIHMIKADVETEVSPAVGGERASEEIINFLLQGYEGDTSKIWESNIFGKSLYDIAGEGLTTKIRHMPENAQKKLQTTLQRIVNEGSGGLICIIL